MKRTVAVAVYALMPIARTDQPGADFNCFSLILDKGTEWTIFTIFPWDGPDEGGKPGLCITKVGNATKEEIFSLSLSSYRLGGYDFENPKFETVIKLSDLHKLELITEGDNGVLCELVDRGKVYTAKLAGNLISVRVSFRKQ